MQLGPPFLSLVHGDLDRELTLEQAGALLRRHLQLERQNLIRYQLGVAIHDCVQQWETNKFSDEFIYHRALYWSTTPGMNVDRLIAALAPVVLNLGVHLQHQGNPDADQLVDVLEWLGQQGALDGLGLGLLEGLRASRDSRLGGK